MMAATRTLLALCAVLVGAIPGIAQENQAAALQLPNIERVTAAPDGTLIVVGDFQGGIARFTANGEFDASFLPGIGANDRVNAAVIQPDGKIIVGGNFTSFNGLRRKRVARLNADGSADRSFDPGQGLHGEAKLLALLPDGKLIVAGAFAAVDGVPRNSIARFNADGSLDRSFDPGLGVDRFDSIKDLALVGDGKMVISGRFRAYNGISHKSVARLNADGSLDASFQTGAGANNSNNVKYILPLSDGRILAGGPFGGFNRITAYGLVRLNKSGGVNSNSDFRAMGGFYFSEAAVLEPDGKIVIAGSFQGPYRTPRTNITRLQANGSLDVSFDTGATYANQIAALTLDPQSRLIIAGNLGAFGGVTRRSVARLNEDGSLDPTFQTAVTPGLNAPVVATAVLADGTILAGGDFTAFSGLERHGIVRLKADGSLDTAFVSALDAGGNVAAVAGQGNGKVLVGGRGLLVHGSSAPTNLIRLNPDGAADAGFHPPGDPDYALRTVIPLADGRIATLLGLQSSNRGAPGSIVRLLRADGAVLTEFASPPAIELGGTYDSLSVAADGRILIGGTFQDFNGAVHHGLVRLLANGRVDATFNADAMPERAGVEAIVCQPGGQTLISGSFEAVNGAPRQGLARLQADGTLDLRFQPAAFGEVAAIQPNGGILLFDQSTSFSQARRSLFRLNPRGELDLAFAAMPAANGPVTTVAVQPDGKVLVGGNFNQVGGVVRNYLARLNADGSLDSAFAPGAAAVP